MCGITSSVRPMSAPTTSLARGMRYAADNGAKVINMSIGPRLGGPAHGRRSERSDMPCREVRSWRWLPAIMPTKATAPSRTAEAAPEHPGDDRVGAVGRLARARILLDDQHLRRNCGAGRRSTPRRRRGGILQQTLDQDLLHTYLRRARPVGRREWTFSPTISSRARRWRRRTSQVSRRC